MGARASLDCVLARNTGDYDDPVWSEVKNVKNPGIPKGKTMSETTTRRSGKTKTFLGTLHEFGLEFEMNADDTDTDYAAFEDSYYNNTAIEVLVLRGANVAGTKGVRMIMEVETFDEKQDQEGHVMNTVKLVVREPDEADQLPVQRYTVPA